MYMVICGKHPLCNAQGVYLFDSEKERNDVAIEHQQRTNNNVQSYILLKCSHEHVMRMSLFTGTPYVDARFGGAL